MRKSFYALLLLVVVAACNKTEDITIPGNVPPADKSIDSATIQLYVNKVFINVLGREPIGTEKTDALVILKQNNFSVDDRKQFLTTLFARPEYNSNLYKVISVEYLQNLDSTEIAGQIALYQYFLTLPDYTPFYDVLNYEIGRLQQLKTVVPDMDASTLNYKGMLKRCVNNYFYDQINMGTENFVVSTFQNFLFRYPVNAELQSGETMVNGANATLFLQLGKTKQDYINIFFDSDDYYEGQVRFIFKKYLFREPTSAEIAYYGNIYKSTGDYKKLQGTFFSLDEYAGIE